MTPWAATKSIKLAPCHVYINRIEAHLTRNATLYLWTGGQHEVRSATFKCQSIAAHATRKMFNDLTDYL